MSVAKQFNRIVEFNSTQPIVGNSGGAVYIAGGLNVSNLNVSNNVTIANLTITNNLFTSTGSTLLSSQWINVPAGIAFTSANVGIGTTTPGFNLDVSGGARITGGLTTGTLTTIIGASIPNLLSSVITTSSLLATNFINSTNITTVNLVASFTSLGNLTSSTGTFANKVGGSQTVGTIVVTTSANLSGNTNTIGNLFTTGGNVGVGTVTPAFTLDVVGTGRFTNLTSTTNTIGTLNNTNLISTNSSVSSLIVSSQTIGSILVITNANLSGNSNTVGSIFTTGGNVGINTVTPGVTFDVIGSGRFTNLFATFTSLGNLTSSTGTFANKVGGSQTVGTLVITTSASLIGNTNTIGNLYTTGGNVGINTVNPQFTLDVIGTARFTNLTSTTNTLTNLLSTFNTLTNLIYTNATGTSLNLSGLSTTNLSTTNLSTTNSTTSNLISTNLLSTFNTLTNLIYTNATGTSLNLSGLSTTNLSTTNLSTTNSTTSNLISTNLLSTFNTLTNLIYTNATGTSLNLSGLSTTNLSTTNLSTTTILSTGPSNLNFNSNTIGNIFTTGGNVGIGIVSPFGNLHVNTNIFIDSTNNTGLLKISSINNTNYIESGLQNITNSIADLRFTNMNAATTFMIIASTGNVGVGIISPNRALVVSNTTMTQGSISINNNGDARYYLYNGGSVSEWLFGQKSNTRHDFSISTLILGTESDKLTILPNGNVGINTTSPAFTLDVNGSGRFSGALSAPIVNISTTAIIGTILGNSNTQAANDTLYLGASGNNNFFIDRTNSGGSLIYGYNTPKSVPNSIIQIFNNSTDKTNLMNIISRGATGTDQVQVNTYLNANFNSNTLGNLYTIGANIGINNVTPAFTLDVTGTARINNNSVQGIYLGSSTGTNAFSTVIASSRGSLEIGIASFTGSFSSSAISGDVILRSSNTNIMLQTNSGTASVYIATSGNVGINTSSPASTLDVNGNIRINPTNRITTNPTDNFIYSSNTVGHYSLMWAFDQGNPMCYLSGYAGQRFFTQGQPRMAIDISGNVGIGILAPGFTLDVNGSGRFTGNINLSGGSLIPINNTTPVITYNGNVVNLFQNTSIVAGSVLELQFGQSQSGNNNAILDFNYTASGSSTNSLGLGFYGANNKLVVQAGGNVGINTLTPGFTLDINSNSTASDAIRIQSSSSTAYASIVYKANSQTWFSGVGGSATGIYSNQFYITGPTPNNIVINTSGNVGINTGSPSQTLDVNGTLRSTNATILNSVNIGALIVAAALSSYNSGFWTLTPQNAGLQIGWNNNAGSGGTDFLNNGQGGGGPAFSFWFINVSNQTPSRMAQINNSGTYSQLSDYRVKNNVKNLDNTFTIDKLRPVEYIYNKTNEKQIGFIAHEIQEIFPQLVEGEKDCENYQTLNYSGLIPVLTVEIQRLKTTVINQQKLINDILQRLNVLESSK